MIALFNLGGGEIAIIAGLIVLLFGASRLPKLAKGLGESIKEFRKAGKELDEGINGPDTPAVAAKETERKTKP